MSGFKEDNVHVISQWQTAFKKATDFDVWGQPVEAVDSYQRLSAKLKEVAKPDSSGFSDEKKKTLQKTAVCLDLRAKSLQNPGKVEEISLKDLKKVESNLQTLLSKNDIEFPLDISTVHGTTISNDSYTSGEGNLESNSEEDKDTFDASLTEKSKGSLLPPPKPVPGKTLLTVRIEKIGLKDASQYIDPFITISCKDPNGVDIHAKQDTPVSACKEDKYVFFGVDIYVQKPIEFLPNGFAIFFEFKHYKPKKKIISTKCWGFLEKDEIKEGQIPIELYKKPTDFRRKGINLLTVKPLYLHLKLTIN